jgi:hypothetical protein
LDIHRTRNKEPLLPESASKFSSNLYARYKNLYLLDMFQNSHHFTISGGIFNVIQVIPHSVAPDQSVCFVACLPLLLTIELSAYCPSCSIRLFEFCTFNGPFYLAKRVTSSFAKSLVSAKAILQGPLNCFPLLIDDFEGSRVFLCTYHKNALSPKLSFFNSLHSFTVTLCIS